MNPYLIIGGAAVWIGTVIGGFAFGHHVEAEAFDTYKAQVTTAEAQGQAKQQVAVSAAEASGAAAVAATTTYYQGKIDAINKANVAAVAGLASDHKLYVHTASCSANPVSKTPGSAAVGDDSGTAELSFDTGKFLIDLASRADSAAAQLTGAQQIILADRQTCNNLGKP